MHFLFLLYISVVLLLFFAAVPTATLMMLGVTQGLRHMSPLILVPLVQSPLCGARLSVRCYSRGGT